MKNSLYLILISFLISFNILYINAATINVTSISALVNAMNTASPNDVIVLADGHYSDPNNITIDVLKSNLTIKSATPGGVYLDGVSLISIQGSFITFSGFQFTSNTTTTGNTIDVSGNNNTLSQINFNGYSSGHLVYISGLNNVVTNCNFQNKLAVLTPKAGTGDMVQIIPNTSNPGNNVIRYCSFQHMPGLGGDFGNECIRIGNSGNSTQISRTVVEFCYFEDTGLGDSEAISVKSRENILRYNTMNNNPEAMFVFRNGDNNVAYGNFFINSGGIRVKETNNTFCFNNYFERCGTTGSMNPVTYVYYTANSTFQLDNVNFLHNTFVDCGPIDFGGIGATNNTWANNIFKKTNSIFINPNAGTTFTGNIYFGGTLGINIPSGMTSADPQLVLNGDGYFSPSATSPVIGAASAIYPSFLNIPGVDTLMLDIKGKNRPLSRLLKDVGCE
jgi:hypothetical protein